MFTRMRHHEATILLALVASISSPAAALEVREPKARLALDVPDDWKVEGDKEFVLTYPDKSFHVRIAGAASGYADEAQAETALLGFLNQHLKNVTVTQHGRRIDWNGYAGFETFGSGEEQSGSAAKWFAITLTDKNDPSRGMVVLGTGTRGGYTRYQPTAYAALQHLRSP